MDAEQRRVRRDDSRLMLYVIYVKVDCIPRLVDKLPGDKKCCSVLHFKDSHGILALCSGKIHVLDLPFSDLYAEMGRIWSATAKSLLSSLTVEKVATPAV